MSTFAASTLMSSSSSSSTTTTTTTINDGGNNGENLTLTLTTAPAHHVTWDETVIDNEGLGRKSSKRCCIYKKPSAWDETSSDESGDDGRGARPAQRPIARKKGGKVPDYQRYHA
mmetsp:Transcript_268/g.494  ORF Transcript_268/g.494 Transcript_268/m.494 type:complete len:115 (+) Transcript_268:160-504(+)